MSATLRFWCSECKTTSMKKIKNLALAAIILTIAGCTGNQKVKTFGGEQVLKLEKGKRLVNLTWKGDNLWILTRQDSITPPSTYHFKEQSSFGLIEGEVTIIETK